MRRGSGPEGSASKWVCMEEPGDGGTMLWVAGSRLWEDDAGSMASTQLGNKSKRG